MKATDDKLPAKEVSRRETLVLKHMLGTPPKPRAKPKTARKKRPKPR
jgi:hypothetical protein